MRKKILMTRALHQFADFILTMLAMCRCIKKGWKVKQLYFGPAFPNDKLKRTVSVKLRNSLSDRSVKKEGIVKLDRSFFRLRDTTLA